MTRLDIGHSRKAVPAVDTSSFQSGNWSRSSSGRPAAYVDGIRKGAKPFAAQLHGLRGVAR